MNIKTQPQSVASELNSADLSRRLQDQGICFSRIAVSMLGYKALSGYDPASNETTGETYLVSSTGDGAISVAPDKTGLQIAHLPFGIPGKYASTFAFNAVDFLMAHDERLKTPADAAKAISRAFPVEINKTEEPAAAVEPCELDVNYVESKKLQDAGLPLSVIAANMGFNVRQPNEGNEYYVYQSACPTAAFVAAIHVNAQGLQIAHYVDPVDGRHQVCAVRFAMQHGGSSYKSPLHANDQLRVMLKARQAAAAGLA